MGYNVEVSGRLLLPAEREAAAVAFLRARLLEQSGWVEDADGLSPLEELGDWTAADCARDGDWVVFGAAVNGEPKWSRQTTTCYLWLSHWVVQGEVRVEGEQEDDVWSYVYAPDRFTQVGRNGWDLAPIPTTADWDPGLPPEWEDEERREAERLAERQRRREPRSGLLRRLLGR